MDLPDLNCTPPAEDEDEMNEDVGPVVDQHVEPEIDQDEVSEIDEDAGTVTPRHLQVGVNFEEHEQF